MRIALLGATSQIAKDLVQSFAAQSSHELVLYARRPEAVAQWLISVDLAGRYAVADFSAFSADEHFDAIFNFVGVGNPAQAAAMGASIFDVTLKYDEMALDYVRQHPQCRYLFLSSGVAYGSSFDVPVDENTQAVIPLAYAISQVHGDIDYIEVASSIASRSAGPATRHNLDEYIETTQDALQKFSGARRAKAILILNPANPPIDMQTTIYAKIADPDLPAIQTSVAAMVEKLKQYVPGYQLLVPPTIEGGKIITTIKVLGAGDYLPQYAGSDAAWWTLAALVNGTDGATYNVGSSTAVTHLELVKLIGEHTSPKPRVVLNTVPSKQGQDELYPDVSFTQKNLGVTQTCSLGACRA